MADFSKGPIHIPLPDDIAAELREQGYDLDDPKTQQLAMSVYLLTAKKYEPTMFALSRQRSPTFGGETREANFRYSVSRPVAIEEMDTVTRLSLLMGVLRIFGRLFAPSAINALGAVAMIAALISMFPEFLSALTALIERLSLNKSGMLISSAYAAVAETPVVAPALAVGAVIQYSIYGLLGVAYIMTLWAGLFSATNTARTRGWEVNKQLSAFFIGVASNTIV